MPLERFCYFDLFGNSNANAFEMKVKRLQHKARDAHVPFLLADRVRELTRSASSCGEPAPAPEPERALDAVAAAALALLALRAGFEAE
jgi:hypothetical protein